MCCLFGLLDYGHHLTVRQKTRLLTALALAAEERGIDATGVAYNSGHSLRIYKRPLPAHRIQFRLPEDACYLMGHTRMMTQGSARKSCNNHPFRGHVQGGCFALAHNGVLCNDGILRQSMHLPRTKVETDSYIAVQLLEQQNALNFDSLRTMAELVEGSFTFTLLDQDNGFWLVKGDSPFCLYHDPGLGLYVYASTELILQKALRRSRLIREHKKISLFSGDLLHIDAEGVRTQSTFETQDFYSWYGNPWPKRSTAQTSYLEEVKSVASAFGYTPDAIDRLANMGFEPEELEEMLYCGEL